MPRLFRSQDNPAGIRSERECYWWLYGGGRQDEPYMDARRTAMHSRSAFLLAYARCGVKQD